MGSLHAVEALISHNMAKHGVTNVNKVDLQERPTFGFGNSMKSQSMSTCYMRVPSEKQAMQLRLHVIPEGKAPVLLSIDTL